MRREIVEAVREALKRGQIKSCCPDRTCDACCTEIARDVLWAALAGESEGVWVAEESEGTSEVWLVSHPTDRRVFFCGDKTQAITIRNALNLSRDLAAGEQT